MELFFLFYTCTCWLWPIVFVRNLVNAITIYPKTKDERLHSNHHYTPIVWASVALFCMTVLPAFAVMAAVLY